MKKGIIIGAGIAGLTTAVALLKKGINVTIYEQAPEINEVGAGIWIAPNAMKVAERLGLAREITEAGKVLEKIRVVDLRNKPISFIDGNSVQSRHGFLTVAIHRARLQQILVSHIPRQHIVLNKKFRAYSQTNTSVTAAFEDGTITEGDFLINADGIKSKGRVQMHPDLNLRYSGQTCWRFVTEYELPEEEEHNMYEIWSLRKGLRVGYSKINDRQVYVFITSKEQPGGRDNTEKIKDDLLLLCAEFPSVIQNMIFSAKAENIIRNDLFDFKPLNRWVDGRVALAGDAAHATTPNLGQGACQAMEDAFVMAEQLALTDKVEQAFRQYQEIRIQKATYITNTSRLYGQITNTSGWLKAFLIHMLRLTPRYISERQIDKIYSLNF